MSDTASPSILKKISTFASATLDAGIAKATGIVDLSQRQKTKGEEDEELFYAKTLTQDPSYAIHSSGYKEKPHRLQNSHLKQMALKSSIVVAIIQARSNQISNYSTLCTSGNERGWRIVLKNQKSLLKAAKEKLAPKLPKPKANPDALKGEHASAEDFDWKLERQAKKLLEEEYCDARTEVENYISNCGKLEGRPFETKRWIFDQALRAWTRDTLTYDMYATETVPDEAGRPHYFFPVDGSTIKFASPQLKNVPYGAGMSQIELDILYPEKEAKEMREKETLDLDADKLDNDDYRYVQVVRGRVERAYTEEELKVGIRNPTTDIYNNGYGISELEMLVSLVTGHLNSEFYNQSYFTQGFSAKGILHIKSNINRRKVETIRQQWQHMLRGNRNSFQTPIFAGVDGVEWIKLDQNHNDIGFEAWLRYLTKLICSIYQIDPSEMGIGFKEEGGSSGGGGLSGDNTKEKLEQSRDRGLFPLLKHLQQYINSCIIAPLDDRFELEWTGLTNESDRERIERLEKLSKFALTMNEVRADLDRPPLPWGDEIVLNREYLEWMSANNGLNLNNQTPEDEKGKPPEKDKSAPKPKEKIAKAKEIKVQYIKLDD